MTSSSSLVSQSLRTQSLFSHKHTPSSGLVITFCENLTRIDWEATPLIFDAWTKIWIANLWTRLLCVQALPKAPRWVCHTKNWTSRDGLSQVQLCGYSEILIHNGISGQCSMNKIIPALFIIAYVTSGNNIVVLYHGVSIREVMGSSNAVPVRVRSLKHFIDDVSLRYVKTDASNIFLAVV